MANLNHNSQMRLDHQREKIVELMRGAVVKYRRAKEAVQHINFLLDANCEKELWKDMKDLEKHLYCYIGEPALSKAVTEHLALGYIKKGS